MRKLIFCILTLLAFIVNGQNCKVLPVNDSVFKPSEKKKVIAEIHTVNLINKGSIQLINHNGKFFLKLSLNEKMGMANLGNLEIKSGSKCYFIKDATYYDATEGNGYFFVDMGINYVATIKDDGITSVIFNSKFESKLQKEDINALKKAAKCFYEMHKK